MTMSFMIGTASTAAIAAIVKFALLPGMASFAGFSLALGLVLVPAGALLAQPWQHAMFTAMLVIFIPLLAPADQMTYDPQQFYNQALAIVTGTGSPPSPSDLVPPLSPALRTRRLLALTLRNLRRLATGPLRRRRMIGRAASTVAWQRCPSRPRRCSVRSFWRRFRSEPRSSACATWRGRLDLEAGLGAALDALARGDSASGDRAARPASTEAWPRCRTSSRERWARCGRAPHAWDSGGAALSMPPISMPARAR